MPQNQCLKLMVAQLTLATKNWAAPVKFDPGQVKIIIDYIRRKFSEHFCVTKRKFELETLQNLTDYSSLVQVMAWCHQAVSHGIA